MQLISSQPHSSTLASLRLIPSIVRGALAEEVGFEPTDPCESTVFKTAAFDHSAIPPLSFPRTEFYHFLREGQDEMREKSHSRINGPPLALGVGWMGGFVFLF